MELCCIYIETEKFKEVIDFYEKVFQIKGKVYTEKRWIEFDFGSKLSIYNKKYDTELINKKKENTKFSQTYIENFKENRERPLNNIVTFNFYTKDLKKEQERIKKLNICKVTEIMYVNITEPYYYFNVYDPEGNTIEICGDDYK